MGNWKAAARLSVMVLLLSGLCSLLLFPVRSQAAINQQISFQGKLTNPDGTNVTNGSYSIVFSIYSVASGGAAIWTETQGSVAVTDGIFQVALGSVTPLPGSVDFNSNSLYLGIKVGADAEMSPRIRFTASPYAFNSGALDGIQSTGFVQLANGVQTDASATNASIAINKTAGSAKLIDLQKNGSSVFVVNNDKTAAFSDAVSINTSATPVTTAGVNGLNVTYAGGAAAVEAAGVRIDYTPGSTSGGTWSGLRIVANTTGPASGVTSYGIKLEGPTVPGAGTSVGIRIASGFDIGADIGSGGLQLATMSDPTTPAAGNIRVYASSRAGRGFLKVMGPTGLDYALQPAIFSNKIGWWTANGNGTGVSVINFGNTTTGTATTRNVATTNMLTATKRVSFVSAGTAGSSAGTRHALAQYWFGNASGLGGFYYVSRFGINTAVATTRSFVGLSATTGALASANPSTFLNFVAFGCDAADTQFTFMHNNGAGAAVKDALTGSFPCNTSGTDLYEARIFVPPNGSTVYYSLLRVNTGDYYEGSTATDLPANTTLMAPQIWINNGTTAAAVDMSVISQYIETDN